MAGKQKSVIAPVALLTVLGNNATSMDYLTKQAVFTQGDKADAMFYIQDGCVKLTVTSKSGKKAVIAILKQGDFFGEGCLGRASLRTCTATAIQPCTITRVSKAAIVRHIHREPALAQVFISYLLFRLGRMEDEFVDQIFSSSEKRLARVLLLLAGIGSQSTPEPVLFVISQETLAEMVGTTRSRVSYFMNGFREKGLIEYNGSIKVHKSLRSFLRREESTPDSRRPQ